MTNMTHQNLPPQTMTPPILASLIDHTLLKPEATLDDIRKLCQEALTHGFASVCVNSHCLEMASTILRNSSVMPIVVVGFPFGANLTSVKVFETQQCLSLGAKEIDMVINIGALKSGDHELVLNDIRQVVIAAGSTPVKVILETAALTDAEIVKGCELALQAGAAFVKTSTGFHSKGGASIHSVQLMRQTVGARMGVKASGGIRTYQDALDMIKAGANRIGASASVSMVGGLQAQSHEAQSTEKRKSNHDQSY